MVITQELNQNTARDRHLLSLSAVRFWTECVLPGFPTGPWFIGEVIDGHSGVCFAFGVLVDGHFLEGSLTYVVGVMQVRVTTTK